MTSALRYVSKKNTKEFSKCASQSKNTRSYSLFAKTSLVFVLSSFVLPLIFDIFSSFFFNFYQLT